MPPTPLYALLDQLTAMSIQGKALRRAFYDDPEPVTKDLTPDARGALYTMNRGVISGQVSAEYKDVLANDEYNVEFPQWFSFFTKWPFPPKEFPKKELPPECAAEQSQEYPDPQPEAFSITPSSGAAGGGALDVEIVGQGFVKSKTSFSIEDSGGKALPVVLNSFSGTFRCGHVKGTVTLPASKTQCTVRLFVDIGGGTKQEVPSALTFDVV